MKHSCEIYDAEYCAGAEAYSTWKTDGKRPNYELQSYGDGTFLC